MSRTSVAAFALLLAISSCDSTSPPSLSGTYQLRAENGQPLPADPSAPSGCCLTEDGALTLTARSYQLRITYRNKNTGLVFDNGESGLYLLQSGTMTFTRTGGDGENVPFQLDVGILSADRDTVYLRYGDEGPGSNQIRATFVR